MKETTQAHRITAASNIPGDDQKAKDTRKRIINGDWDNHPAVKEAVERSMLPPVSLSGGALSISELQRVHVDRQEEWCPDQKPDLSFRGNELGGECGEAQNVIKKLERERHGWRGSRDTVEHLGEELADVIHCAVLCAITAGIDLEPAVIAKFNSTSEKNGLSTMLRVALANAAGSDNG